MKRLLSLLFLALLLLLVYYNKENVLTFYSSFLKDRTNITLDYKNDYYKDVDYNFVKRTSNFIVDNKDALVNVYYTVINSGIDEFTFFCNNEYKRCIDDVISLADDQQTLSNVNAFVHPFNSFESLETTYDTLGRVTIKVNKIYTDDVIKTIDEKATQIISDIVGNETNQREIVKKIHDYIIDNTRYDTDKADKNITKYQSNTAYGPLLQGYGICGGYTDAMAIFLNYYEIPNYKVVSENHIWNAVYLDGAWYHLDLTWDDPISKDGSQTLDYSFFLITTKDLLEEEQTQHNFDKTVFTEIAN